MNQLKPTKDMKWIFIVPGLLILLIAVVYIIGSLLSIKHKATIERKLEMGVDEVWPLLTNFKGYTNWRKGIKELTMDSTNRWTEKNSDGDKVCYQLEVIEKRRVFITRILNKNLAYGGFWEFNITPLENGCLVHITENGEVYNPIFRFMSKYIFGHEATLKNYMNDLETKTGSK